MMRALVLLCVLIAVGCTNEPVSDSKQIVDASPADLVLMGGTIRTMDAAQPWANAIALRGREIVYVGGDDGAKPYIGPTTRRMDLAGRAVLPGLHDAHTHLIGGGLQMAQCNLMGLNSVDRIEAAVRECHQNLPEGEWLMGGGWNLSLFENADPKRQLLDEWAPGRAVYLAGEDGHTGWASTAALQRAAIGRDTEPPPGGVIERESSGEPSGTLREDAMYLIESLLPEPTAAERLEALARAVALANSLGITSVIDAAVNEAELRAFHTADQAGDLTLNVVTSLMYSGYQTRGDPEALLTLGHELQSEHLRTSAVKIFVDGVLEGETAALLEPYIGGVGHSGALSIQPQPLADAVTQLDRRGIQVHMHAIGDRAVRVALDAVAAAREANGVNDHRHHIAHLQLIHPDDYERFGELNVTANFQALWAYMESYITDINLPVVGEERVRRMYPIGSLARAGARIVGGSDWSVSTMNPLPAIETALTREDASHEQLGVLNASEAVDLNTMLRAYTTHAAWLMHQEDRTGMLKSGMTADLIVLDRNLFATPVAEISDIAVDMTFFEGELVYERKATE